MKTLLLFVLLAGAVGAYGEDAEYTTMKEWAAEDPVLFNILFGQHQHETKPITLTPAQAATAEKWRTKNAALFTYMFRKAWNDFERKERVEFKDVIRI